MKKVNLIIIFSVLIGLSVTLTTHANNISVSTPTLTGQNNSQHYVFVQFDLSWDNSFRDEVNWDAVWVFVKYKVTDGNWSHATLNTSGHSVTTTNGVAATIDTPSDGKGVFLYRTSQASGSINWDDVKLRWNYGTDGVADDATVTVKVFAIEMVYVPTGTFAAGSGGSETSAFTLTTINTGNATTAPSGTGGFSGSAEGGYPAGQTAPDDSSWPNGYSDFYCTKYEISQGQYADFLNTLTASQDLTRFPGKDGSSRHTIGGSTGSRSASVPDRACNCLSWMDGCAYMDWSGLRPMTELEFEKACRGAIAPVANEYAWGNTNIAGSAYTLSNNGQYNEAIATNYASEPTGNTSYSTTNGDINGPLRCGIFATNSSTRAEAGASYYGVMEMSGNLWERTVTIENVTGRGFTGTHGDGALSDDGNATNSDWPGYVDGEVTGATGSGFRGGDWYHAASYLRVSARNLAVETSASRVIHTGFRGVRTAP